MATVANTTPALATTATANPGMTPSLSSNLRNFPLRILVNSDIVGAIIGRSGSTIRSITQRTKARIDVHREENPEQKEKVITISGDPESCSDACYEILKICHNEYTSHLLYQEEMDDIASAHMRPVNVPHTDVLHILAPSNLIGRLIGRGGASIKKMMEQTSTKIKISVNALTESTGEHTITVVGDVEKLRQAEKLISSKLRAAHFSDMNMSIQSYNHQPYLFNNVPMPYSSSYATHQNPLLASIVSPQTAHGARSMSMNHQGQMGSQLYPAPSPYLPLYPNVNVQQGSLMNFNALAPRFELRETVYIYIPSTMVGAIIGKSGTAIKEMISASGASIKVATTSPIQATESSADPDTSQDIIVHDASKPEQQANEQHTLEQNGASSNSTPSTSSTRDKVLGSTDELQPSADDRKNSASRLKILNPIDVSSMRKVTVVGYPPSQYTAQYLIYRKVSIESGKSDISLMVEIHVPSQLVGKIIGKGGAAVKNLQKQTRTTIRLPVEKPGQNQQSPNSDDINGATNRVINSETVVQITGEFEGSQAAQRHIRSMIRESQLRQARSKPITTRIDETQRNSNAQTTNSDTSYKHQQDDVQAELVLESAQTDDSLSNKGADPESPTDKNEERKKLTEKPPKTESLPSNSCDRNLPDNINTNTTTITLDIVHEEESHFADASVSSNGQNAQLVSNNNTIKNLNLSDSDSLDAALSKSSDIKGVTRIVEESKVHPENGDLSSHQRVTETSEQH